MAADNKSNGFRAMTVAVVVGLLVSVGGALLNKVIAIDAIEERIKSLQTEVQVVEKGQQETRLDLKARSAEFTEWNMRQDRQLTQHEERISQILRTLFGPG